MFARSLSLEPLMPSRHKDLISFTYTYKLSVPLSLLQLSGILAPSLGPILHLPHPSRSQMPCPVSKDFRVFLGLHGPWYSPGHAKSHHRLCSEDTSMTKKALGLQSPAAEGTWEPSSGSPAAHVSDVESEGL